MIATPQKIRKHIEKELGVIPFDLPNAKPEWANDAAVIRAVDIPVIYVQRDGITMAVGGLGNFWQGDPDYEIDLRRTPYKSQRCMQVDGSMTIYELSNLCAAIAVDDIDWQRVKAAPLRATGNSLKRAVGYANRLMIPKRVYVLEAHGTIRLNGKDETRVWSESPEPTWHAFEGVELQRKVFGK